MKKNGFISITLIYTLFILLLMLMMYMLNSYSRNKFLLGNYKQELKRGFYEDSSSDINLFIYVYDLSTKSYEPVPELGNYEYEFISDLSFCSNPEYVFNGINYVDGEITISAGSGTVCKAYFKKEESEINIYIKTGDNTELIDHIPDSSYSFVEARCENGADITFDESTRLLTVESDEPTVCEAFFELGENGNENR